jgi:Fe-S cluster assembly protein SufD
MMAMTQASTKKEPHFSTYKLITQEREQLDPAWLANLREKAGARFEALDFPTLRDEEWKYTNLAPLLKTQFTQRRALDLHKVTTQHISLDTYAETRRSQLVFIDGLFSAALSDRSALPAGVTVCNLANAPAEAAKVLRDHLATQADYHADIFTALNTANLNDGALIHLPAGKMLETPIHLLFLSTAGTLSHPCTLVVAEKGATATIVRSYAALDEGVYFTNAVTEIIAQQDAVVTDYRVQQESEQAFHIGATQVYQERGSHYTNFSISLGAALSRHNLNVVLGDERTQTTLDGLYVMTGQQHCDNYTTIDHAHPHGTSHQLYKGILDGAARAVFNGKVFVREGAQLTDANQLNKNLLLSAGAHVDTKPQLEIFADDVKCSHGATVGQLEDEELFYLAARGISSDHARALLTYGFAEDIISKIKLASVHKKLDQAILEKLHQSLDVR